MKHKLEDYNDGQHLDHRKECWRLQDCICNYDLVFINTKEDIEEHCKGCEHTSICKGLIGNSKITEESKHARRN